MAHTLILLRHGESDWNQNFLSAYARGSFNRFADFESENTDEFGVGNGLRQLRHLQLRLLEGEARIAGDEDVGDAHVAEPRRDGCDPLAADVDVEERSVGAELVEQAIGYRDRRRGANDHIAVAGHARLHLHGDERVVLDDQDLCVLGTHGCSGILLIR